MPYLECALGAPVAAASPPVPGDWIVQAISADPTTLNPILVSDETGAMLCGEARPLLFESLLASDVKTQKFVPGLAQSWEVSPDQLVYTFHLFPNAHFSDGVPLTAADVKFTFDKIQDPQVDCPFLRLYFSSVTKCDVLDPLTVRFIASQRYYKTLSALGGIQVIPKHLLGESSHSFNSDPFGRNPVGSGPYKFLRWETGSNIVLERDDHYWRGFAGYAKRLVFEVVSDAYVEAQLLKKGDLDLVDGVAPLQYEREIAPSRSAARLQKIVHPYPAYSYFGFNLRKPLFRDQRVRHALDLLIPRDVILQQISRGYSTKTSGYDLPSAASYNPAVAPTPYDPALAQQLLRAAGWALDPQDGLLHQGNETFQFTVIYPGGGSEKVLQLIQESYRQAGIDLKLSRLQFAQLLEELDDWNFEATIGSWTIDTNGDPYQIWDSSQAVIKQSSNFLGYANPAADRLIRAGRLEYDDAKRAALFRELHQIIHDDYPCCFLFNPNPILLVSDRFKNVQTFSPLPCFDLTQWWVPAALQRYRR